MSAAKRNIPELLTGLGIIAVAAVIALEAATIKVGPLYAKVGPSAFLWFSSGLLALCGAIVALKSLTNPPDSGNELVGPAVILTGLAASVFLIEPLGFIPVATLIFVLTARGMGSSAWKRDLLIGIALSCVAYVVFTWGLGLRLPIGELFSGALFS
ncbi:MAG: tripartite tricarboxylate transporter TctB family protein [Phyllobacteriaceae bacterium]|nr:tripartite tricarboxylate transporter TctB family protein [Phyllobacteriaceae bacterium]